MKAPDCLVCGQPLRASGGDTNMFYCVTRKEHISEWNVHVDYVDTIIYVDPIDRRETMWVVEIPPYRFTMTDFSLGQKTEVHKTVMPDGAPWDQEIENREMFLQKKLILKVACLLNLPWHDRQKVLERLKLYLLFS